MKPAPVPTPPTEPRSKDAPKRNHFGEGSGALAQLLRDERLGGALLEIVESFKKEQDEALGSLAQVMRKELKHVEDTLREEMKELVGALREDLHGEAIAENDAGEFSNQQSVCETSPDAGLQLGNMKRANDKKQNILEAKKVSDEDKRRQPTMRIQESQRLPSKISQAMSVDSADMSVLRAAIKQDPICAMLEDPAIAAIVQNMKYYEFKEGEKIIEEGGQSQYFFVSHNGVLEVLVNGTVMNTLNSGSCFGGAALVYDCPRTATVIAKTNAGVWAVGSDAVRSRIRDHSEAKYAENRQFLDTISLFDGLPDPQKDMLVKLSLHSQMYEKGARIVTEGDLATAIHSVKKGELSVYVGGKVDSSGTLIGGTKISTLKAGETFGERVVLYNEQKRTSTVIADSKCELLCISLDQLRELLGSDISSCLQRRFILSGLNKSSVLSQFSLAQHNKIMKYVLVKDMRAGQKLIERPQWLLVIDGTVANKEASIGQGQILEDEPDAKSFAGEVVAGKDGARIAVLTPQDFVKGLNDLGMTGHGSSDAAIENAKKILNARKVPIFHHLTQDQIDVLTKSFALQRYTRGSYVFAQGEVGTTFFVIASGQVEILIDNTQVRTLAKNAHFGERALLFDEPRTATVRVLSEESDLWCLEKQTFAKIVTGRARDQLVHRITLQDTSVEMKELKHVQLIGAGSFGSVRLVEHVRTGVRFALKRVRKKNGIVPPEVEQECALLGESDHPFIMQMVKTFVTDGSSGSIYILTELIIGGELFSAIREIPRALSRSEAQFYTGSLVLVLESLADRYVVFRDLKPENVMLDNDGYLKLIDFGIAKKLDASTSRTFTTVGTVHYMAPEIMRGIGYGTEVDIWSLGVILFEFVCGYMPFGNDIDDPAEVCAAVLKDPLTFPREYSDKYGRKIIEKLLDKRPEKRLGGGVEGFNDIKSDKYFKLPKGNLFDKIIGRELTAPVVPKGLQCTTEEELQDVTLSDHEELA